jgi:hypothetical protein
LKFDSKKYEENYSLNINNSKIAQKKKNIIISNKCKHSKKNDSNNQIFDNTPKHCNRSTKEKSKNNSKGYYADSLKIDNNDFND